MRAPSRPQLEAFARRCETAWPRTKIGGDEFIRWLEGEVRSIDGSTLDKEHATDLFLVYGCSRRDPEALRALETRVLCQVARHIAKIDPSPSFADEVLQELRERLLMSPPGSPPRISAYRASGPLGAWIRAAAIRTAHNLRRARKEPPSIDYAEIADGDPEIDYVRRTYAEEFRAALEVVLASQAPPDREILRLHYLESRNIEQVGESVGAHRATIARRLHRIRDAVLQQTCEELKNRLGLDSDELEALLSFARDEVDVSLARILIDDKESSHSKRSTP